MGTGELDPWGNPATTASKKSRQGGEILLVVAGDKCPP